MDATGLFFGLSNNAATSNFEVNRKLVIQNSPTKTMKLKGSLQVNGDIRTTRIKANGAARLYIDDNCVVGLTLTVNGKYIYNGDMQVQNNMSEDVATNS